MHVPSDEFLDTVAVPLGWFYLTAAAMNLWASVRAWRRGRGGWAGAWLLVAAAFTALGTTALCARPLGIPEVLKDAIDWAAGPVSVTLGVFALLVAAYLGRRWLAKPGVAMGVLDGVVLVFGLSLVDPDFASVAAKPDNVAIVGMVFLLGFFTWLGTAQAVENDRRAAAGEPPEEKEYSEKVLVWPDLVYIELIGMILVTVGLMVWSLLLPAPLEPPANPVATPNPAKAPWYFLGLQELLVFSDAWWVGVVVPCLILFGLAAIPYLDRNPRGSGYYTVAERPFAYKVFQFGFLQLWILLILVGTFMRGPNWSFFGPYEARDPHKTADLTNVKLGQWFWEEVCRRGEPQVAPEAGWLKRTGTILYREIAGLVLLGAYFVGLPLLLARAGLKRQRAELGRWRFLLMVLLLLAMITLPLKMLLRWSFGLSYIVSIPEWSLNF
jgi:hypothetical protein